MLGVNKKGYFFIVDAIVGLTILSIGVVTIFSFYSIEPTIEQSYYFSTELIDTLITTPLWEINNEYGGPNGNLTANGNITNIYNTIIEQVAEFYYRRENAKCPSVSVCNEIMLLFLDEMVGNISTTGLSYSISINNELIYNNTVIEMNDSYVLLPSRFIVHGLYQEREFFGPYTVEVLSWY